MAEILARCYPTNPAERVAVIPWGVWPTEPIPETEVHAECERQRSELALAPDDLVLLTLSRLSPEKGIDLLLEALRLWEAEGGQPPPTADSRTPPGPAGFHNESSSLVRRLRLLICGEAAYMRGQAFVGKLKRQAARLRQVRVSFLGHVSGVRKRALFGLAHLYVFPSRHESYGLTLVEAMAAGLPVLTSNHYSARETVPPDCGLIASWQRESEAPHALKEALNALLADPARLRLMGQAAARRARAIPFSTAAEAVAATIDAAMGSRPT
jgi:glycosyltransferase involved in cell wall biosynthesis